MPLLNPFLGVDGPGNCLPGPCLPFSLVRLGPDTLIPQPTSGYRSDDPIIHFSHTHVSGTGGAGRYGNIGVSPFVGKPVGHTSGFDRRPGSERAAAGYYEVVLEPIGVRAELTSTPRTGLHRYTFSGGNNAGLLIDLGAVIQTRPSNNDPNGWAPVSTGGYVELCNTGEVVGRADLRGGWGHGFPYSVYFAVRADQPTTRRMIHTAQTWIAAPAADGPNLRVALSFGDVRNVTLRVGISYASVAHARASLDRECTADFDTVRARAAAEWDRYLSRIQIEGATADQRAIFYTLFSRLVTMPTDLGIDDEFGLWRSGVRHYSDYYCLWDSVRNANSLIALIDPDAHVGMMNCLLDIGRRTGWIPDAWIAGHSAMIQGGSSADILLAESAIKKIPGIDYAAALAQVRKNSEVESPDPYLYGRHLPHYRDHGYVAAETINSVSRHLEYAYQDWCLAQLAAAVGESGLSASATQRSRNVWNLWRDDLRAFAPRLNQNAGGTFVEPFDPDVCRADSWNDPANYEGTSRQWSFNVQHDFAGLIARHGGDEKFVAHLDEFFAKADVHADRRRPGNRIVWDHYDSKETMLHVPYLYLYAGRPDRTADVVAWALAKYFSNTRNGLADNEDMGCQAAFYMCSTMGLYPLMGQDVYWLTTPAFAKSTIATGSVTKLTITRQGDGKYVQSIRLNGTPIDRAFVRHHEITGKDATIEFATTSDPTAFRPTQRPPSPLSGT